MEREAALARVSGVLTTAAIAAVLALAVALAEWPVSSVQGIPMATPLSWSLLDDLAVSLAIGPFPGTWLTLLWFRRKGYWSSGFLPASTAFFFASFALSWLIVSVLLEVRPMLDPGGASIGEALRGAFSLGVWELLPQSLVASPLYFLVGRLECLRWRKRRMRAGASAWRG